MCNYIPRDVKAFEPWVTSDRKEYESVLSGEVREKK